MPKRKRDLTDDFESRISFFFKEESDGGRRKVCCMFFVFYN
jgi:hypothetical protein